MPFYYNRIAAADYGTKWAVPGARNSTWPDFSSSQGGGGDCTNFISQCLYAGGWNMRQAGYVNVNPYAWYCRPAVALKSPRGSLRQPAIRLPI
jgi:Putative amidase domain